MPAMPAPAISGPRLIEKMPRIASTANAQMNADTVVLATAESVVARTFSRSSSTATTPSRPRAAPATLSLRVTWTMNDVTKRRR